jgi:hypothetical protein
LSGRSIATTRSAALGDCVDAWIASRRLRHMGMRRRGATDFALSRIFRDHQKAKVAVVKAAHRSERVQRIRAHASRPTPEWNPRSTTSRPRIGSMSVGRAGAHARRHWAPIVAVEREPRKNARAFCAIALFYSITAPRVSRRRCILSGHDLSRRKPSALGTPSRFAADFTVPLASYSNQTDREARILRAESEKYARTAAIERLQPYGRTDVVPSFMD